ncbi:alpha/beta hydrolase [Tsuneonella sp. YG55]|uniref:Alpha/beta hydrolase n=1 Tax=Tsuneonella litorea TaxID=2976475 RepID=A0A9X2VYZ7_9SPHN|nr:alpha/beta hydrolase [Tsuneonella litorea]MCT2557945.1 alpha/beta hydrolase [Tsuneonella litorea]
MGTALALGLFALAGWGVWRWAVAQGSAATLEWIDARFARETGVRLAAEGTYGAAANQNVELWVPDRAAPAGGWPLVVWVYGGGWHSGTTKDYRFVARTLGDAGFATALVGYRLVQDGGRFPAMLEDTAAGVRWARDHAGGHGVRTGRIALAGHSAGAYNVLMLALDPQWLAGAGVPEDAIGGVASLAGPADFYPFTSDSARNALGYAPDPARTQPIRFARGDAPPILLLHGTADDVVRIRNSRRLAQAAREAGGRVEERAFPGMGHAGIVMGLSRPFAQGGIVRDPMVAFLRSATAPGSSVPVQREPR